jgi:RNA polymerase sigma factor (sigma-70 family)
MGARALLEENLELVRSIVRFTGRRRLLDEQELEDLESYVNLKLVEGDYRILRQFEHRSSLKTYLTVVIQRLFLDYLHSKWGKWRPSAAAKRRGSVAIRLEELMNRDGMSFDEAVETLTTSQATELGRDELFRIVSELPVRQPRRMRTLDDASLHESALPGPAAPEVTSSEVESLARSAEETLRRALGELRAEDRLVLKLRFNDGLSVPQISSALDLESKPLYRRINKCLDALKQSFEAGGLDFAQLRELVEWGQFSLPDELESTP